MKTKQKLQALRAQLKEQGLDGYIQPLHDEYMSEYPPACNRRVEWLAGFSGSAGSVAVLSDSAAFFTDGRYTLQARTEVDDALFELHNSADKTPAQWMAGSLKNTRIGYDPKLYSRDMLRRMEAVLRDKSIELVAADNLVDAIWQDRPAIPASEILPHEEKYHGEGSSSKRKRIAEALKKYGVDKAVISAPDSVCWLLNIRAHDVECTPLLLAPAIIDAQGKVQLFVAENRVSTGVSTNLGNEVSIVDPKLLPEILQEMGKSKQRVLCDPATLPVWYLQQLDGSEIIEKQDPCILPKAMKNNTEIESIRAAHLRDGVAVIRLLHWLEVQVQDNSVSETDVADKLLEFRQDVDGFIEPSFHTIAGSGPNGAIVHYRANEKTSRTLEQGELFLLDSGGQYPDGTTDITRTITIGEASTEHKDRFTRVLKGHIALAMAIFPRDTKGSQLDSLARQYLWQAELDYEHGTGHGVGLFLGVHEGPQRISKRGGDVALEVGMVVSNEPGYYKNGEYGIRIENLVVVREHVRGSDYLCFDTLSCVPIDTRLIEMELMTDQEKEWLNAYHSWVLAKQKAVLSGDDLRWLEERCAAI